MKFRFSLFLISLSIISNLNAGKIVMSTTFGKQLTTPSYKLVDDRNLIGLGIRGYLNKNYAIDMRFATSKSNLMQDGGKTDIERGSVNLFYDLYPNVKVSPYLFAGGGYEKLHRVYKNIGSQSFGDMGVGLRVDLTKSIEFNTEIKYLKKARTKDDEVIATMGFGVKFGQNQKKQLVHKKLKIKEYIKPKYETTIKVAKPAVKAEKKSVDTKGLFCDEVGYAKTKISHNTKAISKKIVPKSNFIQIASLTKIQNVKKTIKGLKSKGLKIKVLKHSNFTTVLVGPYKKSKISKIFQKVKLLHKDAFYKKL